MDIHTDEEQELLWEKLALIYGYYDAVYEPGKGKRGKFLRRAKKEE